jgi:hypothetical protein
LTQSHILLLLYPIKTKNQIHPYPPYFENNYHDVNIVERLSQSGCNLIPKLARKRECKDYLIEIIGDKSMAYPDHEKLRVCESHETLWGL